MPSDKVPFDRAFESRGPSVPENPEGRLKRKYKIRPKLETGRLKRRPPRAPAVFGAQLTTEF